MCIGGPWSPSLDGENPLDPQTLINTAVRSARTLTGLNLSGCARWYYFIFHLFFSLKITYFFKESFTF